MSKKMPNDKSTNKPATKQMKVFLTNQEHAVVTLAANIKGMNVGDYMKKAIIEQAKKDAKEMNKLIDSI
ncbi:MAG: hypothetical protein O2820_26685 [Planctomycetota bacterium]|nr:hypothetical protein [Planctomycetota bacterium]